VLGPMTQNAHDVLSKIASQRNAAVVEIKKPSAHFLNLPGEFQKINAAIAEASAKMLSIPEDAIEAGLKTVEWNGRWQTIESHCGQKLILDAAHNEPALIALAPELEKLAKEGDLTIVFSSVDLARARTMAPLLEKYASAVILVKLSEPRALKPAALSGCFSEKFQSKLSWMPLEELVKKNPASQKILVLGSFVLIGTLLKLLRN
jgi:folylpolyglutamate synthase/dihydropteroate synthase